MMDKIELIKQPSTWAGMGLVANAIAALVATGGADVPAWAQLIGGLCAMFISEKQNANN